MFTWHVSYSARRSIDHGVEFDVRRVTVEAQSPAGAVFAARQAIENDGCGWVCAFPLSVDLASELTPAPAYP